MVARFTAEEPLPKAIWRKWVEESCERMTATSPVAGPARRTASRRAVGKRTATK